MSEEICRECGQPLSLAERGKRAIETALAVDTLRRICESGRYWHLDPKLEKDARNILARHGYRPSKGRLMGDGTRIPGEGDPDA